MAMMEGAKDTYYTVIADEKKLGMKFNGVEITTIVSGGWAERVGVEIDDEIFEVNGKEFGSMSREEKLLSLQGARPTSIKFKRPAIKDYYYLLTLNEQKLGMGFKGSKVSSVAAGGWAERNGIYPGDEIVEVAGQPFGTLADDQKINAFKAARPFDLKLKRPASTTKKIEAARQEPTLIGGGMASGNGLGDGKPISNQNNKMSGDKKDERGFFAKLFTCCSTQPTQPSTEHDINYR